MGQSLKNVKNLIKAASTRVPIETCFVRDLEATIELAKLADSSKPSKTYKPSSMNCIRNMYYQVTGMTLDPGRQLATSIGIAESGTDRHLRIQEAVTRMSSFGMDCQFLDVSTYIKENELTDLEIISVKEYETKIHIKSLNMTFLCDGLIQYKGQTFILEIKTETSFKHNLRDAVAPEHITQAACYSAAFKIPSVLFLYENRDNCCKKPFILEVTEEMKSEALSKIKACDFYVESMVAPPIPPKALEDKKFCRYCNYKEACSKNLSIMIKDPGIVGEADGSQ